MSGNLCQDINKLKSEVNKRELHILCTGEPRTEPAAYFFVWGCATEQCIIFRISTPGQIIIFSDDRVHVFASDDRVIAIKIQPRCCALTYVL